MMTQRFELKRDDKGWSVVDRHTGEPAEPEGRPAVGLELAYATDLAIILNASDMKRRITRGHIV